MVTDDIEQLTGHTPQSLPHYLTQHPEDLEAPAG
jgi:hypothetical protein